MLSFAVFGLTFGVVASQRRSWRSKHSTGSGRDRSDRPGRARNIIYEELLQGIDQYAAVGGLRTGPRPRDPSYEYFKERALGIFLEQVWTQGEAAREGIRVPSREVTTLLGRFKRESFDTEAAYRANLRRLHLTPADAREEWRLRLLNAKLQEAASDSGLDGQGLDPESSTCAGKKWGSLLRRFPQRLEIADVLRLRIRDRSLRKLPMRRHPREAPAQCYESDPQE